jgi:hypothetical protein
MTDIAGFVDFVETKAGLRNSKAVLHCEKQKEILEILEPPE